MDIRQLKSAFDLHMSRVLIMFLLFFNFIFQQKSWQQLSNYLYLRIYPHLIIYKKFIQYFGPILKLLTGVFSWLSSATYFKPLKL